jgi:hypothetical protein
MPMCKKCGEEFPKKTFINGKQRDLRIRSYCLKCSPFGLGNNRKLEIERPIKRKRILTKELKECPICKKIKYISNMNSQCGSCKNKLRRNKHKAKALGLLGGECYICKYNKCINALDFHHIDPNKKSFTLSSNWHWSWDKIEEEVKKCLLLCSRCHTEIHEGIIKL